jgi:hypothetical protein
MLLPGDLEVENFDRGGEGVAYHDFFGATNSGAYRAIPIEGVDVLGAPTSSNGFVITEAAAGEWTSYSTYCAGASDYVISVYYASAFTGGTFHIEVDGVDVTGPISVISTGSWEQFVRADVETYIENGGHLIRLVFDSNSVDPSTGAPTPVVANFDKLRFRELRQPNE